MTKFVYIADTHFGANPMGYQQQKGYPEKLVDILALLDAEIQKAGDIDFILHGGDMIDRTDENNICRARELFRFSIPVYLCLGNHDLTEPMALDMWMTKAPEFFQNNSPNYSIENSNCSIHVIPNHWCNIPFYWEHEQSAHFLLDQINYLEMALARRPDKVHIFCTHSPILGVPCAQTGFAEVYHYPGESFSRCVFNLCRQYTQIKCILSGHNHINTNVEKDGVHYVTASAFVETPFEFKLIEIGVKILKVTTISLLSKAGFRTKYDFNKTYIQGREKDRSFKYQLS